MSLHFSSLNSGSNGNCYYIGNDNEAVLIDAGISCREVEKRMKRLRLSIQKVRAIFISHEHKDHIKGLSVLSCKYDIPVYITPATHRNAYLKLDRRLTISLEVHQPVFIGDLCITAFSKLHDAADPCSFRITCNNTTVGVFTDIGALCDNVITNFQLCHAAFLESNYDEVMLEKGSYTAYLKRRIRGGYGHLSNRQALELFLKYKPPFMTHLVLSHLSHNNNCPDKVQSLFDANAEGVQMIVASRFNETPVYYINNECVMPSQLKSTASVSQMTFSFA